MIKKIVDSIKANWKIYVSIFVGGLIIALIIALKITAC